MTDTATKVIIIIKNHVESENLPTAIGGTTTIEMLKLDSLDCVDISLDLEAEFAIDIEADLLDTWTTVQDVIDTVENLRGGPELPEPGKVITHDSWDELTVAKAADEPAINRISRADLAMFVSGDNGMNTLDLYQSIAVKSAIYPGKGTPFGAMYCALGLGEAGEIQNKVKKAFRDDNMMRITGDFPAGYDGPRVITTRVLPITPERRTQIIKEMGGNLWYLAALADELGITLSEVAAANLTELCDRGERNTLRGDGDNR